MTYSDVTTRQQRDALAQEYDRAKALALSMAGAALMRGDLCTAEDNAHVARRAGTAAAVLRSEQSQTACVEACGQYRAAARMYGGAAVAA